MHEVKHSSREAPISAGVAAAWKPEGRPAAVLLRWFATHWCNYRCPYCRQNHARRQPIDGHGAHCFDNCPADQFLTYSLFSRRIEAVVGVHDSDFQQIQGGQQIGSLD
jgi:hypothetical protein